MANHEHQNKTCTHTRTVTQMLSLLSQTAMADLIKNKCDTTLANKEPHTIL